MPEVPVTDQSPELAIQRITVRIQVGEHMLAASDDPLFLGLTGRSGREFRLVFHHGRTLKRGAEDHFVLGSPDDRETNVAHPELNDPSSPTLDATRIESIYLRKGFEPIPNVRAVGEMDDRLEIVEAEVLLHVAGRSEPIRYFRPGPIWLGLVCGLRFEIGPVDAGE
jgi:hypothetical protein